MKKKMLSITIALMPILASYRSIIPNVDLGTFAVLVCLFICFTRKSKISFARTDSCVSVFLYILFFTPMLIALSKSYRSILLPAKLTAYLRWGKMIVAFLLPLTVAFKEQYSETLTIETIRIAALSAVVVVIVQRVAYLFGVVINNPLSYFAINDAYAVENYTMIAGKGLFRPSAFFLEPSHFAQYVIYYLVFSLFTNVQNHNSSSRKNKVEAVIILSGLFCTGSGMGFALAVFVCAVYILINSKKDILRSLMLFVLAGVAGIALYRIPFVQKVLERIFTNGESYGGNAVVARIGNGYELFSELPLLHKFIGYGYGNIPVNVYLNGLTYCLIALGIAGTALFLLCLISMFKGNVLWKKISIVIYFSMVVFAQLFTPGNLLFIIVLLKKNSKLDNRTV